MAKTMKCECGRTLPRPGWASHAAACDVERARSEAFIAAIEAGEDPHVAGARAVALLLGCNVGPARA